MLRAAQISSKMDERKGVQSCSSRIRTGGFAYDPRYELSPSSIILKGFLFTMFKRSWYERSC